MNSLLFRPLPAPVKRALLRYVIWENERYLADCARCGIHDSRFLRELRGQIQADRVQLALLQPPTRSPA